jgi:hypothetical protein
VRAIRLRHVRPTVEGIARGREPPKGHGIAMDGSGMGRAAAAGRLKGHRGKEATKLQEKMMQTAEEGRGGRKGRKRRLEGPGHWPGQY